MANKVISDIKVAHDFNYYFSYLFFPYLTAEQISYIYQGVLL
jgi:hypothetical protein